MGRFPIGRDEPIPHFQRNTPVIGIVVDQISQGGIEKKCLPIIDERHLFKTPEVEVGIVLGSSPRFQVLQHQGRDGLFDNGISARRPDTATTQTMNCLRKDSVYRAR